MIPPWSSTTGRGLARVGLLVEMIEPAEVNWAPGGRDSGPRTIHADTASRWEGMGKMPVMLAEAMDLMEGYLVADGIEA